MGAWLDSNQLGRVMYHCGLCSCGVQGGGGGDERLSSGTDPSLPYARVRL
jgi:hypothetical protein